MSENIENLSSNEEIGKKDNNPLSVRIDATYKDMFEEIIKEKDISKKALLESMILSYIEANDNKKRNANIDFSHEIALVSGSLNEILETFKSMVIKTQDTIGSRKDFYEQQIQNFNLKIQTLENRNLELEEKIKLLEAANNGYNLEKENYEKTIEEMNEKLLSDEKEKNALNFKTTDLLEQINLLRKVERENAVLKNENEGLIREINRLRSTHEEKSIEVERLKRKLDGANNEFSQIKQRKADELAEFESKIKKEAEIEIKSLTLELQIRYNDLQSENLKNLGIINQKSEEINTLNRELEKMAKELENLHSASTSKKE